MSFSAEQIPQDNQQTENLYDNTGSVVDLNEHRENKRRKYEQKESLQFMITAALGRPNHYPGGKPKQRNEGKGYSTTQTVHKSKRRYKEE